eukprot:354603-Chlamydomonas_euryale.AAC.9
MGGVSGTPASGARAVRQRRERERYARIRGARAGRGGHEYVCTMAVDPSVGSSSPSKALH